MSATPGIDKILGPVFTDQRAAVQALSWRKPGSTTKAGGTLPVPTTHGYVAMTTGGAEALTLADGEPGQRLTIVLATDGGDGTLTPSRATGWATCVFADAGDTLNVEYVDDTIGWIVTGYSGKAAPPVMT